MRTTTQTKRLHQLLPKVFDENKTFGHQYLKFKLMQDLVVLMSAERIQEAILIPSRRITPIPQVSSHIIGVTSSQNRVFAVLDIKSIVSQNKVIDKSQDYQVIVLKIDAEIGIEINDELNRLQKNKYIGFSVERVLGTHRIQKEEIKAINSHAVIPELPINLLKGFIQDKNEYLYIIDDSKIISSISNNEMHLKSP